MRGTLFLQLKQQVTIQSFFFFKKSYAWATWSVYKNLVQKKIHRRWADNVEVIHSLQKSLTLEIKTLHCHAKSCGFEFSHKLSILSFVIVVCYLNFIIKLQVNEPRYKRCGVTPHLPKTKKIAAENFAEAGSAITIDNGSTRG